jgi:hypothetical protein
MNTSDSSGYERYTEQDLYRDMEVLRKAGIIQVEGISDDGQWLYGITELGKELMHQIDGLNFDVLAKVFENIQRIEEEGEQTS